MTFQDASAAAPEQQLPTDQGAPGPIDLFSDESRRLAKFWMGQVEDYGKEWNRWEKRTAAIERRYRDDRPRPAMDEDDTKRCNVFWANVEILQPALYGRTPVPVTERRFRDKDPVGRGAAQILERALRNEVEICGLDDAMQACVKDYLLGGRGVAWVRYEPEIGGGSSLPVESELDQSDAQGLISDDDDESPEWEASEQKLRQADNRVLRESTPVDYIPWPDFILLPARARSWREVTAIAKRVYMTREQMIRRFGDRVGRAIPFQRQDRDRRRPETSTLYSDDADRVAEVYELWYKSERMVYWFAEGYDFLADAQDDPLRLSTFFPVPKPLFANWTNNTLIPVPDFIQYQSQAIQIDELTQRIAMLAKGCKWAGVYDASQKDIQRLFDEATENQLIPVDSWAAFAEKGGVAGCISLLPLKEVIGIINELTAVKEKQVLEMNQLTGITDIMRGTSDARETMGGQRLKTNNSMTRLQKRQAEVARFARDIIRIMAEVMSMHFSPQSLIEASGALYEEGLGPDDMPPLTALQGQVGPAAQSPGPAMAPPGPAGSPGLPSSQPPRAPGPPPAGVGTGQEPPGPPPPAAGGPPQQPGAAPGAPGTNVVPFQRPGVAAAPAPGVPPSLGAGAPSGLPPELAAKLEALVRIAKSIQLLRDEKLLGFRVDIEVDSTVAGDAAQEKADRTEFLTMTTKFMEVAMKMSAEVPEVAPLMGKMLQFGVRGFRVGRDLESAIEDFVDEAENIAKRRQEATANNQAEQVKAQADMMKAHSAVQVAQIRAQSDAQRAQADSVKSQFQMQSDAQQAQAEVARQQLENQGELANSQYDMETKRMEMEMRREEMALDKMRINLEMLKIQDAAEARKHEASMPKPQPAQSGAGGL